MESAGPSGGADKGKLVDMEPYEGDGTGLETMKAEDSMGVDAGEANKSDGRGIEETMRVAVEPYNSDGDHTSDGHYSSEHYKVEILGLPQHIGYLQLKKLLTGGQLKLWPKKISMAKVAPSSGKQRRFVFVTFANESLRDEALIKIHGHVYKGRTLSAKKASAKSDPILGKRVAEGEGNGCGKRPCSRDHGKGDLTLSVDTLQRRLLEQTTPLYHLPYDKQLKVKQESVSQFVRELTAAILKSNRSPALLTLLEQNGGVICPVDNIKPSPLVNGYRNKCEFTCGYLRVDMGGLAGNNGEHAADNDEQEVDTVEEDVDRDKQIMHERRDDVVDQLEGVMDDSIKTVEVTEQQQCITDNLEHIDKVELGENCTSCDNVAPNAANMEQEENKSLTSELKQQKHNDKVGVVESKHEQGGSGRHHYQQQHVVGFRVGSYKQGSLQVVSPHQCPHVSDVMKDVVTLILGYISLRPHQCYDPRDHSGVYHTLTMRTSGDTASTQVMIILDLWIEALKQSECDDEVAALKQHLTSSRPNHAITSAYVRYRQHKKGKSDEPKLVHIVGVEHITEQVGSLQFRISPDAFFQVNTPGAEVLYDHIRSYISQHITVPRGPDTTADSDKAKRHRTILLDICCGTGTIGQTILAGEGAAGCTVDEVIGLELCEQSVADARWNASVNGVSNSRAQYICGPAEEHIKPVLKRIARNHPTTSGGGANIIAIVDPPRSGLGKKLILSLRRHSAIQHLVYVSCNARAAQHNFITLCQSESNKVEGRPFHPVHITPVDLFPHTNMYELVIVFKRM